LPSQLRDFESNRGIGLVSRDGGAFSQMVFSNILFDCRHGDPCHWGKADPVFVSLRYRAPDVRPGNISQITFSSLNGVGEGAINLHSEIDGAVRDITFNGLTFTRSTARPVSRAVTTCAHRVTRNDLPAWGWTTLTGWIRRQGVRTASGVTRTGYLPSLLAVSVGCI
jgi:hypothetical protein